MSELNRLADLKETDPEKYQKELKKFKEKGYLNETTGKIFSVLDTSRLDVGSAEDKENYKKINIFRILNSELSKSRYDREFGSPEETAKFMGYENIEEFLNTHDVTTKEQEHFLKNNEFKYTPKVTHFQQEYYRNNYQTRSTSQESGRTKMSNELQERGFALSNGTLITNLGDNLTQTEKEQLIGIMNREGVPFEIALKILKGTPILELTAYIEENYAGQATLESLGLKSDLENYEIANGRLISDIELSKSRNSGLRSVFTLGDNFFGLQIS